MTRLAVNRRAALGLAAGPLLLAAPGRPRAQRLDRVSFLTDWRAQAEHGGFYQAQAAGLYRAAGLEVELRTGGPQVNPAQLLVAGGQLLGYFVAMRGVDEVHLLNITVAPAYQGQGWARVMLDALRIWATGQRADWLWLEVRTHNLRARAVYEAQGYLQVGLRKNYYPAAGGQREDALVMSLKL